MDIAEKNGQPSMEEILASIRRIIAEEPAGTNQTIDFNHQPIMLNGEDGSEDGQEFDLPAIFRAVPTQPPERSTALLGRLTDAIRNATSAGLELKAVPIKDGDQAESSEPRDQGQAGRGEHGTSHQDGLSSLRSVRNEGHETRSLDTVAEPRAVTGVHGEFNAAEVSPPDKDSTEEGVRRVMVPFKDTTFLRLAKTTVVPTAPEVSAPPVSVAPSVVQAEVREMPALRSQDAIPPGPSMHVDFASIVPQRFDGSRSGHGADGSAAAEPMRTFVSPAPPTKPQAVPPPPSVSHVALPASGGQLPGAAEEIQAAQPSPAPLAPPTPAPRAQPTPASGSIEDATADLLRPMLRQWLADNMPRMVEKALHIEVAESVKGGRKPSGE